MTPLWIHPTQGGIAATESGIPILCDQCPCLASRWFYYGLSFSSLIPENNFVRISRVDLAIPVATYPQQLIYQRDATDETISFDPRIVRLDEIRQRSIVLAQVPTSHPTEKTGVAYLSMQPDSHDPISLHDPGNPNIDPNGAEVQSWAIDPASETLYMLAPRENHGSVNQDTIMSIYSVKFDGSNLQLLHEIGPRGTVNGKRFGSVQFDPIGGRVWYCVNVRLPSAPPGLWERTIYSVSAAGGGNQIEFQDSGNEERSLDFDVDFARRRVFTHKDGRFCNVNLDNPNDSIDLGEDSVAQVAAHIAQKYVYYTVFQSPNRNPHRSAYDGSVVSESITANLSTTSSTASTLAFRYSPDPDYP